MNYTLRTLSLSLLAVACLATRTVAQDIWIGPNPNDNWFNNNNWQDGSFPTATDNAQINNGGTARINSGAAAAKNLALGFASGDSGELRVNNGSTLSVVNNFFVGNGGNGTALLQDTSGTTVGGEVNIGRMGSGVGEMTVRDDASLAITGNLIVGDNGNGTLTLRSLNTVTANNLRIGNAADSTGVVDIAFQQTNTFNLTVNNTEVGNTGDGTLHIHDGGSLSTTGSADIGNNSLGTGSAVIRDES
jgi:T5SS/PEP-CTERM-associated repeat protein